MANKLELTWIGKDEKIKLEPRLLIEDADLSNTEYDPNTENMLIHGDNLLALKALEKNYYGKIDCIYIDPPYNVDSMNEHYEDMLEHSTWLNRIKPRLEILRNLLKEDGAIFIQISDEEQAYLKIICDEIFGRKNFVNMISVNMKNSAGASGGGEDKRLKKNCEYILIYAKNYNLLDKFVGPFEYTEIYKLVTDYRERGKSWKYTTVLTDIGAKEYIGTTLDGSGNEIKIFKRKGVVTKSIRELMRAENLTEEQVYARYGKKIFRTTNSQSSIRKRILDFKKDNNITDSFLSIEYIPRSGKHKGQTYEQLYKNNSLVVWLADTLEEKEGKLFKKDQVGTYWDMNPYMKNVASEGGVTFVQSKKPEKLIAQIIEMATSPGDLVLDSFLGSGTTIAVAHKLGRKYIGIEMGDQAYSLCKPRMDRLISGNDSTGISNEINWNKGGGYRFYELAPPLLNKDKYGQMVINTAYDPNNLPAAVALHEGFRYQPDQDVFWKQSKGSEGSYLFVTTNHLSETLLEQIYEDLKENEFLIIACPSFDTGVENKFENISVKKIPQMLLDKCEFSSEGYQLNIFNPPKDEEEDENYYEI